MHEYSGGVSIKANINLVKRNAAVGSQIAVHLANLQRSHSVFNFYNKKEDHNHGKQEQQMDERKDKVIVLGGSAVDFEVKVVDGKF